MPDQDKEQQFLSILEKKRDDDDLLAEEGDICKDLEEVELRKGKKRNISKAEEIDFIKKLIQF